MYKIYIYIYTINKLGKLLLIFLTVRILVSDFFSPFTVRKTFFLLFNYTQEKTKQKTCVTKVACYITFNNSLEYQEEKTKIKFICFESIFQLNK